MAGYMIHIAVGKVIFDKNKNMKSEDYEGFLQGIIMPDYKKNNLRNSKLDKGDELWKLTHSLDMNKKFEDLTPYELGYFVHLVTDKYFYQVYNNCGPHYEDYNFTNKMLMEKYNLDLPVLIEDDVEFKQGAPRVLKTDGLCKFIDEMSNLNLKKEYEKCKNTEMNNNPFNKQENIKTEEV